MLPTNLCESKVRREFEIVTDIWPVDYVDFHRDSAAIPDLEVVAVRPVHLQGREPQKEVWSEVLS